MRIPSNRRKPLRGGAHSLEGQLLIAMPTMPDRRFQKSVIYMCAHSAKGAMGLIVNQRADHISFSELLEHLEIEPKPRGRGEAISISDRRIHVGGPVETARGFVLHSPDYASDRSTLSIDDNYSLTATVDIVRAIARGSGPSRSMLALGYAQWSPGQLEREMQANGWLHCAADEDLVFGKDLKQVYGRALSKIGIEPGFFVTQAGHA